MITMADVQTTLRPVMDKLRKPVSFDADMMTMFVGVVNGALGMLEGAPGMMRTARVAWEQGAAVGEYVGKAADNISLKGIVAGGQIIAVHANLLLLASETHLVPGQVYATLGTTFVKGITLCLAQVEDNKRARLVGAIADIVTSLAAAGYACSQKDDAATRILAAATVVQACVNAYGAYKISQEPEKA